MPTPLAYFFPPDSTTARAVSLAPVGSGLVVPLWPNVQAWSFNGFGLAPFALPALPSALEASGFAGAAAAPASGAWFVQNVGSLVSETSGASGSIFSLPPATVFTGVTYVPGVTAAYAVSSSGNLYTPSGTGSLQLANSFGSPPAQGLASSGQTLFTILAAASGVGTFALTASGAGTSGFIATPFPVPTCITASTPAAAMVVGGWGYATLTSGYIRLAVDPVVQTNMIGVVPGTNAINLLTDVNETWSFSQSVSGTGAPSFVAWSPDGLTIFATDPVSGKISQITFSAGVITATGTITLANASAVSFQSDASHALVCQPTQNQVTPYALVNAIWVSGAAVALAHPVAVVPVSVSGAAIGFASGVAFLSQTASVWSVTASAALPYPPSALATDILGNVYAVGSAGSSGFLSVFNGNIVKATVSWVGSGVGVVYSQGQIAVADPSNSTIRVFGPSGNTFGQYTSIATVPGVTGLMMSPLTLFASASGAVWEYDWTAPYTLERLRSGQVSFYQGGGVNTATLGVNQLPMAVAIDVSGAAWAATLQNELYTIQSNGTISASGLIATYANQKQTAPLGISAMMWWLGTLYATSSLCGALIALSTTGPISTGGTDPFSTQFNL